MLGVWEIVGIITLVIVAWFILGKKFKKTLPEVGKTAGETLKEFKKAITEVDDIKKEIKKK